MVTVSQNKKQQKVSVHWFRRDLRLNDNTALYHALKSGFPVLPIFIFDIKILNKLQDRRDKRVDFIHQTLKNLNNDFIAKKLLDYELSSNNANWQWAAGTGCDAAPYFRIFNPMAQAKKFDPALKYINTWIKDSQYNFIPPVVEHSFARKRALEVYKKGLNSLFQK